MRAPEEMLIEGTKGWHVLVVPGSVGHQDISTSTCSFSRHLCGGGGCKKGPEGFERRCQEEQWHDWNCIVT